MISYFRTLILLLVLAFLSSCLPTETDNPEKAYKYWSGSEPAEDVEVINGQYYQSPHFTLEYEVFLELQTDKQWFDDFVRFNKLERDTVGHDWSAWAELPKWFYVDSNFEKYSSDQSNAFEKSRYFFNRRTGQCFIYETLGM